MPTVAETLQVFEARYAAMLEAARDVREAVSASAGVVRRPPTIAEMQEIVAMHYGCTIEDITRQDRHAHVSGARHVAISLCCEFTSHAHREIAQHFGGRSHTTIRWAANTVQERSSVDAKFAHSYQQVRAKVIHSYGLAAAQS